jgi:hypothetical protein
LAGVFSARAATRQSSAHANPPKSWKNHDFGGMFAVAGTLATLKRWRL